MDMTVYQRWCTSLSYEYSGATIANNITVFQRPLRVIGDDDITCSPLMDCACVDMWVGRWAMYGNARRRVRGDIAVDKLQISLRDVYRADFLAGACATSQRQPLYPRCIRLRFVLVARRREPPIGVLVVPTGR